MYQFMVGTETPEVTRMAMTSGANKWASRIVVILQLAAWSAVGIVLLQKGVSSLQKGPDSRNNSQTTPRSGMSFQSRLDERELPVIPIFNENQKNQQHIKLKAEEISSNEEFFSDGVFPSVPINSPMEPFQLSEDVTHEEMKSIREESSTKKNDDFPKKYLKKSTKVAESTKEDIEEIPAILHHFENDDESMKIEDGRSSSSTINSSISVTENSERLPEKTDRLSSGENNHEVIRMSTSTLETKKSFETTTKIPGGKAESVWETRRRLRLSHLSGGGAAAAVAMVAVGAVMLVLGPAVIVLRALDERRQERRFLKLSGRDDLPPSYEQATLMDEAPRYSSLSLNTILGPPPPPSPTPARIHLV